MIATNNTIFGKELEQNEVLGPFIRGNNLNFVEGTTRTEEDTILLEKACKSYRSISSIIKKLHQFSTDLNKTLMQTIKNHEDLNQTIFTLRRGSSKLLIMDQDLGTYVPETQSYPDP